MEATELSSCLNCKYFTSFRDDYFDDMEPDDKGFCSNGDSPRYGNEDAGRGYVCKEYCPIRSNPQGSG